MNSAGGHGGVQTTGEGKRPTGSLRSGISHMCSPACPIWSARTRWGSTSRSSGPTLVARELKEVKLATSDPHDGLNEAIAPSCWGKLAVVPGPLPLLRSRKWRSSCGEVSEGGGGSCGGSRRHPRVYELSPPRSFALPIPLNGSCGTSAGATGSAAPGRGDAHGGDARGAA
jgi:hypothetical protein